MAGMTTDERKALLQELRFGSGHGEHFRPLEFVPIEEHLRAIDQSVVLVVGERGAGKTVLNAALRDPRVRGRLAHFVPGLDRVAVEAAWVDAFPLDRDGPMPRGWQDFAQRHSDRGASTRDLWFAYLVRSLGDRLVAGEGSAVSEVRSCAATDVEALSAIVRRRESELIAELDQLDRSLESSGRGITVSYDELDTLIEDDWVAFGEVIRGLVRCWMVLARRWKAIRSKIFLRTDFYARFTDVAGADIAKLGANRVELTWSDRYLYAVLLRAMGNRSAALRRYAQRGEVRYESDAVLGHLPVVGSAADARPFIERLCGRFMGANANKGLAFHWLLNAVRDGNGRASPRSLLQLVERAADRERQAPRAQGVQLLHHTSLRNALDDVSKSHVDAAVGGEWKWLARIKVALARGPEVPWERRALEGLLRPLSSAPDSAAHLSVRGLSSGELVDYLIDLGIFRVRGESRVDVPDLYLSGLDLRRRGGVGRR